MTVSEKRKESNRVAQRKFRRSRDEKEASKKAYLAELRKKLQDMEATAHSLGIETWTETGADKMDHSDLNSGSHECIDSRDTEDGSRDTEEHHTLDSQSQCDLLEKGPQHAQDDSNWPSLYAEMPWDQARERNSQGISLGDGNIDDLFNSSTATFTPNEIDWLPTDTTTNGIYEDEMTAFKSFNTDLAGDSTGEYTLEPTIGPSMPVPTVSTVPMEPLETIEPGSLQLAPSFTEPLIPASPRSTAPYPWDLPDMLNPCMNQELMRPISSQFESPAASLGRSTLQKAILVLYACI